MSNLRELMRREKARRKEQKRTLISCCNTQDASNEHTQQESSDSFAHKKHSNADNTGLPGVKKYRLDAESNADEKQRSQANEGTINTASKIPIDFFDQPSPNAALEDVVGPRLSRDPAWVSRVWENEKLTVKEEYFVEELEDESYNESEQLADQAELFSEAPASSEEKVDFSEGMPHKRNCFIVDSM